MRRASVARQGDGGGQDGRRVSHIKTHQRCGPVRQRKQVRGIGTTCFGGDVPRVDIDPEAERKVADGGAVGDGNGGRLVEEVNGGYQFLAGGNKVDIKEVQNDDQYQNEEDEREIHVI